MAVFLTSPICKSFQSNALFKMRDRQVLSFESAREEVAWS